MSSITPGFPHTIEDTKIVQLQNKSNWTLQGHSKAGERTSFRLEPLNILLDIGVAPTKTPKAILLTHSHIDHTWQLPNIYGGLRKDTHGQNKIRVYFPEQAYLGLTKLLEAACVLTYPKETFTEKGVWDQHFLEPCPIKVGDIFTINRVKIEVLQATHVVHSVGYGFTTEKTKLKEEYRELSNNPSKIIELRKQGIEVSETILQPELAFYCDSTIENLVNYEEWKKYPSIVVECTGYPKFHIASIVKQRGHTHLDDLLEIVPYH